MIITLPRKVRSVYSESLIPIGDPLCRISRVKNGVVLHNPRGEVIAQVFSVNGGMRATVADGGTLVLTLNGKNVDVKKLSFTEKENKEVLDKTAKRTVSVEEYVFFGNAQKAQYEIFARKKDEIKPSSIIRTVAHPLNDDEVNVEISNDFNLLYAICICLAIDLLVG